MKGAVKVSPLTDFLERFEAGRTVLIETRPYVIESCTWYRGKGRMKLKEVTTREAAESLKWKYVNVSAEDAPNLEDDEFLSADLVGLSVVEHGVELGVVDEVLRTPAHDLLRIGTTLIPAVKAFIKSIDIERGVIEVTLIPGLRPSDSAQEQVD